MKSSKIFRQITQLKRWWMLRQNLIIAIVLMTNVSVFWAYDIPKDHAMPPATQVNQLVSEVQRLRGLPPVEFGADGQIVQNRLMFKYLPDSEQIIAAILVAYDPSWNRLGDEFTANYRHARAALSDPAIGLRFDTAGGAWIFEEDSGKTYLYTAFGTDTPASEINAQIDRMARVVPAWEMYWLAEVARIAHGKHLPPAQPVTLEANPYAGKL